MKYFFVGVAFSFISCNSGVSEESKPFIGIWEQTSSRRIEGDPAIDKKYEDQFQDNEQPLIENDFRTFFEITEFSNGISIDFKVTDQASADKCDSVRISGNELNFRKINQNNTTNSYQLKVLNDSIMSGILKSWNGNTYFMKYKKMPRDFEILYQEPSI